MCETSAGRRSSISHVPYDSRYRGPLVILVPITHVPDFLNAERVVALKN